VNTDAACFEKGEIEICAGPRRLVICGLQRTCKPGQLAEKDGWIFRFLDLPTDVIPSLVAARFKGRHLEIDLPIAQRLQMMNSSRSAA
ncbi:MAG: Hsp20/alpha crystallin family protein, partial [Candidatus Acidiferrales bacterium]